ncbi:hypothetical protein [Aliidongia dinghuensis]|uniref:hypothetical protein n=1 Tax=Aliidongia dinghuensis TaxID=1867774 RepID=UPI0016669720|nr:hypothetical protein [Aliidongia dinghuensis]
MRNILNNNNAGWDGDALVNPTNLQDLEETPLYDTNQGLAFDTISEPAALSLNWPTTRGYSTLIVDNGGKGFSNGGTVNFTYQAALDSSRRLVAALAARPTYQPSAAFKTAYSAMSADLQQATASSAQSTRGKYGQLALDQAHIANDLMLSEYGHAMTGRSATWLGTTFDTTDNVSTTVSNATVATPHGWVRMVFDPSAQPSDYTEAVNAAHAAGLKVLGQPIDSSEAASFSQSAYVARFQTYIQAFPNMDAWEIGNEVNGSWLGSGMGQKIAATASYVAAAAPKAQRVLTLYWQIGTDAPEWSTFNWARANLPASTRNLINVVLLSTYVEDAPMGLAFDQIMNELHTEFPNQKIGLGELGYWSPDTSQAWWAISPNNPTTSTRRAVANQYYSASLGYSFGVGGGFWWYFAEDTLSDPQLTGAIRAGVTGAF